MKKSPLLLLLVIVFALTGCETLVQTGRPVGYYGTTYSRPGYYQPYYNQPRRYGRDAVVVVRRPTVYSRTNVVRSYPSYYRHDSRRDHDRRDDHKKKKKSKDRDRDDHR